MVENYVLAVVSIVLSVGVSWGVIKTLVSRLVEDMKQESKRITELEGKIEAIRLQIERSSTEDYKARRAEFHDLRDKVLMPMQSSIFDVQKSIIRLEERKHGT